MIGIGLREQRGGALIISMLILVTMIGLGTVSLTSARMEMALAGNYRSMKQAQYLAEAGLVAVGRVIVNDPGQMIRRLDGPLRTIPWTMDEFGADSLFVRTGVPTMDHSFGYDSRPVNFVVWVEDHTEMAACPGTSADACCRRVALVSEGRVGYFEIDGRPSDIAGTTRRRVRAEYAIPYLCGR